MSPPRCVDPITFVPFSRARGRSLTFLAASSDPIHPPGTAEQYLPKDKQLGPVDLTGLEIVAKEESQEEKERKERDANKPDMSECLSLYDFEVSPRLCPTVMRIEKPGLGATQKRPVEVNRPAEFHPAISHRPSPSLSCRPEPGLTVSHQKLRCLGRISEPTTLRLISDSSGADDEITMRENRSAYQRLWFRPRILRDVTNIDFSTTILGHKVRLARSPCRCRASWRACSSVTSSRV